MTRAYQPRSLSEALDLLGDRDLGPVPVAGCTDLMVVDHAEGRLQVADVDLLGVPELHGVQTTESYVDIGAACTFTELRNDPAVCRELPILAEASATIGGWQIQNRATLGGNIANASPAGDSLPVLLALSAELVLASTRGRRTIPYVAMHTGYRQTALLPGEIIARVRIPRPRSGAVQLYRKVGTREAQAISKVAVAFSARRIEGRLVRTRIGAGSVAATPIRLLGAEQAVEGLIPAGETAERAARFARSEVRPIDDVRSTAEYRRFVLGRVVRRMVLAAAEEPALR